MAALILNYLGAKPEPPRNFEEAIARLADLHEAANEQAMWLEKAALDGTIADAVGEEPLRSLTRRISALMFGLPQLAATWPIEDAEALVLAMPDDLPFMMALNQYRARANTAHEQLEIMERVARFRERHAPRLPWLTPDIIEERIHHLLPCFDGP